MSSTVLKLPVISQASVETSTFESRIKAEALRLGFAFCGVTTAEPPTNHEHYQAWGGRSAGGLKSGIHVVTV